MISAAHDFKRECESIAALMEGQKAAAFDMPTQFKNWTFNDIIGHLHLWNIAADLTLTDPAGFATLVTKFMTMMSQGKTHPQLQAEYFAGKSAADIYRDWADYYPGLADRFAQADPAARLKWAGPDMSASACIIARQMEHWAHAQAMFDALGVDRVNTDGLKNIAHIGITTYSWSFKVKSQTPILPKPYVRLTAPSGAVWEWNDPQDDNKVEGDAEQFCQVVTQCRNINDTQLQTTGTAAKTWMDIAQCFAGGPQMPPPAGTRFKQKPKG